MNLIKSFLIVSLAMAFVLVFAFGGIVGYLLGLQHTLYRDGRAITVARLSPDEMILAQLVEVSESPSLDRRFRVQLQSFSPATLTTIFHSPEEEGGGSPGTERLIWSKDGTKLLLVGRHFFVKDDLFLDNGDQLYFLHDLPTGQSWSNADQPGLLPPLRAEMVEGVEFTEPVVMKKMP